MHASIKQPRAEKKKRAVFNPQLINTIIKALSFKDLIKINLRADTLPPEATMKVVNAKKN